MWLLSPPQVARLVALQRSRDLQRIGDALAGAFPGVRGRLAERWDEFIIRGAERAAACGLDHMLCVARLLATWVACGADFDSRKDWAASILTDRQRSEGAKAFQLCTRVLEELRSAPQPGQPAAPEFADALRRIDKELAGAGNLASLLPRERIRLGDACDVDAIDLRLTDTQWRQHYTAQGGPWRREGCAPAAISVTLVHDVGAEEALALPAQISLLSRPAAAGMAARLRVRVRAAHRCDPLLHPLVQCVEASGARSLRGDVAADSTLTVHARMPDGPTLPHIGEEDSPQLSLLEVASCGLRASGVPIGELSTRLAAYDAAQHLVAWRREPATVWQLPQDTPPPIVATRCRRELDGAQTDSADWVQGFEQLDAQLQQGLARLLTAWERESGVTDGKLSIDAALLAGSAGVTWGWAERQQGIAAPPYMRLEALLDLVACRLALRFGGSLALAGSRSMLELTTDGSTALKGPWLRGQDDALFAAAGKLQVAVHQRFELAVRPIADAGLAVLSSCGPLQGAISGRIGLEQRPDGPGLRWFVRLNVEPLTARLCVTDPLLGVQFFQHPLLPAQAVVDWSVA
jgi:hypothetical protein